MLDTIQMQSYELVISIITVSIAFIAMIIGMIRLWIVIYQIYSRNRTKRLLNKRLSSGPFDKETDRSPKNSTMT